METVEDCWENYYAIGCESTTLGDGIDCYADHWSVRVSDINSVLADTSISITIENVSNPAAQTTGKFEIHIIDSTDDSLFAIDQ